MLQGGVVAFPTETVYGLGAIATNSTAVEKIFKAKNRPADNPLICHFFNVAQIKQYVASMPPAVELLLNHFAPGPLSVLLPLPSASPLLPATLGRPAVICRIPNHPVALELLQKINLPIAAPSANISGRMSGTTAEMVEEELGDRIDGVVNGGLCAVGLESTILDCRNKNIFTVLRPGVLGRTELQSFLNTAFAEGKLSAPVLIQFQSDAHTSVEVIPGAKYRHYAPNIPVQTILSLAEIKNQTNIAVVASREEFFAEGIFFENNSASFEKNGVYYFSLGSKKDLSTIACSLYQVLFNLDHVPVTHAYLLNEEWGEGSVALALKNRLEKIINK